MDAKNPFIANGPVAALAKASTSKDLGLGDEEIPFLLRAASQSALAALQNRLEQSALTTPQFFALSRLSARGALSQNELGRQAGMDPATIQGVTQRLLARGLIQRHPDAKDRRRLILSLTDQGIEVLAKVGTAQAAAAREALRHLNAAERQALAAALKKIAGL